MAKAATATYAYCVVANATRPRPKRKVARLPGMGPVRLLDVDRGLYLAVADAPLDRYGETAVLPMKLFTIFTSDERALTHVRGERQRILAVSNRVANQHEWGVRVILDRERAVGARTSTKNAAGRSTSTTSSGI